MTRALRFEDLPVWRRSRELARQVYKATSGPAFIHEPTLRNQMRRSAVSVSSNIAEGFERSGSRRANQGRELHQFLSIAKGSAGELRAQTYIARDTHFLTEPEAQGVIASCLDVSKQLGGMIQYLHRSRESDPL